MNSCRPPTSIGLIALLPMLLVGCSSTQTASPSTAPTLVGSANPPVAPKPTVEHFELALDLLQKGQPQNAEVELRACLKDAPDNKAARNLIAQIETPVEKLLPPDNFVIKLAKDESLSTLAKTYLGDPLQFYALARYNGIAVPAKVNAGQAIKIPRTATAIVAQQTRDAATPSAKVTTVTAIEPKPKPDKRQLAEREYKKGMIAFQRQDLDGAIAAWDNVLVIEPDNQEAQLNRAQALRLKENLKKLQH